MSLGTSDPPTLEREQVLAQFHATLSAWGVREALAYLLRLTNYRFIGIFRFREGMATAVVFYDREHPAVMTLHEVPESATYCCFVRNSRGVFVTAHALLDERTENHPARERLQAYCGVPIMDAEGVLFGTLCHYDLVPRDPEQVDLSLMLAVASTLAQGHVPAYPG